VDELVKLVTQKAGISNVQAEKAVKTVMAFLKEKLPAPVADQVEGALNGKESPDVGDLGNALGGVLGKK
jgi:nucleoid DNA-binding protein